MAVTVEITERDIEHGHIAKCRSCPTALAANRATARFCDTGGFHLIAYDNSEYIENENLLVGLLPEAARVWIVRFDGQRDGLVNPSARPVELPHRAVPGGRLHQADGLRFGARPARRRRRGLHGHRADHRGPPRTHRGEKRQQSLPPLQMASRSPARDRPHRRRGLPAGGAGRSRLRVASPRKSQAAAQEAPDRRLIQSGRGAHSFVTGRLASTSWRDEEDTPHSIVEIEARRLQTLE